MPAGSKMDPPLAKAKTISDSGSASVITYLRRKQPLCNSILQQERGVGICERNNSADTKVGEEEGGGGAGAEIPLQPMEKTMVRQAVALKPMEVHSGSDLHLQTVEDPMPEQVDVPEEGCDLWRACAGADSWQDLWTCGEKSPRWSRFAGSTCDPVGRTHAGAVNEELQSMGRIYVGEVRGGLSPMGGTTRLSRGRE